MKKIVTNRCVFKHYLTLILVFFMTTYLLCGCNISYKEGDNYKNSKEITPICQEEMNKDISIDSDNKDFLKVNLENSYNSLNEKYPNIAKISIYDNNLLVFYNRNEVLTYNLKDKSIYEFDNNDNSSMHRRKGKALNNSNFAIIYEDMIKIFNLESQALICEKKYSSQDVTSLDISEDGYGMVYTDYDDNLYLSNIDMSIKHEIEYKSLFTDEYCRARLPKYVNDSTIVFEVIGDFGVNLAIYNILYNNVDTFLISDRLLGHTNYLDITDKNVILSSEFECLIINLDDKTIRNIYELSESASLIPELSHSGLKLLYVNSTNKLIIYNIQDETEYVLDKDWENGYLSWSEDDAIIFGNKIMDGKSNFCIYEIEKNYN